MIGSLTENIWLRIDPLSTSEVLCVPCESSQDDNGDSRLRALLEQQNGYFFKLIYALKTPAAVNNIRLLLSILTSKRWICLQVLAWLVTANINTLGRIFGYGLRLWDISELPAKLFYKVQFVSQTPKQYLCSVSYINIAYMF